MLRTPRVCSLRSSCLLETSHERSEPRRAASPESDRSRSQVRRRKSAQLGPRSRSSDRFQGKAIVRRALAPRPDKGCVVRKKPTLPQRASRAFVRTSRSQPPASPVIPGGRVRKGLRRQGCAGALPPARSPATFKNTPALSGEMSELAGKSATRSRRVQASCRSVHVRQTFVPRVGFRYLSKVSLYPHQVSTSGCAKRGPL